MLETRMKEWIANKLKNTGETNLVKLYKEEKEYVEKKQFVPENIAIEERTGTFRFSDAYIELGNKETDEFLGKKTAEFLQQSIDYFKSNKNEFMYMESEYFDLVGVDAVSFEVDDVFGTYNVMFGLKLQKKFASEIRAIFKKELTSDDAKFELMFDGNEGLWNVNLALNDVEGFEEGMSLETAYSYIYRLLFKLAETIEQA